MQSENVTTFTSDRPAQQGFVDDSKRSAVGKRGTHLHHRDDDPILGSFMGLRVEEQQPERLQEGQDFEQQASQGVDEAAIDKSSIFDREGSQQDLSKGIGMSSGFGGYSDIGRHHISPAQRPLDVGKSELREDFEGSKGSGGFDDDIGQQQNASKDWFQPSEAGKTEDIGRQQQSVGEDWAQSSEFGKFSGQNVGTSDVQGVESGRWPQNQGVWNPSLQGDSSSADKDISSQFDAGGSTIDEASVSRDKGPYSLDIQGQQVGQQAWESGESKSLLGNRDHNADAGDFSYGSTASGYNQGLANEGVSASDRWEGGDSGALPSQDADLGSAGEGLSSSGWATFPQQQANVSDFGRGDLRDQSGLSGDKSTFSYDAEEKQGQQEQEQSQSQGWQREDRVHGLAKEDFI